MIKDYVLYMKWRHISGQSQLNHEPLTYEQFVIMSFHSRKVDWSEEQWVDLNLSSWDQQQPSLPLDSAGCSIQLVRRPKINECD